MSKILASGHGWGGDASCFDVAGMASDGQQRDTDPPRKTQSHGIAIKPCTAVEGQ